MSISYACALNVNITLRNPKFSITGDSMSTTVTMPPSAYLYLPQYLQYSSTSKLQTTQVLGLIKP
jgi:hypothetical protein